MSADWVTAIATAGTFVVIAASAAAALVQLRHMRTGNQISAYNECRETMDSREFREALAFIRGELPERLKNQATVKQIAAEGLPGEYAGVRLVANLFESMGLFVRTGMMDERIACELWSGIILDTWNTLRPITATARAQRGQGLWVNFEYMAVLATDFFERYGADGAYPPNMRRMPLDEPAVQ